MIQAAGATPCGVAIALDRQEKATENGADAPWSAVQYVQQKLGPAGGGDRDARRLAAIHEFNRRRRLQAMSRRFPPTENATESDVHALAPTAGSTPSRRRSRLRRRSALAQGQPPAGGDLQLRDVNGRTVVRIARSRSAPTKEQRILNSDGSTRGLRTPS